MCHNVDAQIHQNDVQTQADCQFLKSKSLFYFQGQLSACDSYLEHNCSLSKGNVYQMKKKANVPQINHYRTKMAGSGFYILVWKPVCTPASQAWMLLLMLLYLVPAKTTVISLQNTVFLHKVVLPQPVVWLDQVDFASSDDEFP